MVSQQNHSDNRITLSVVLTPIAWLPRETRYHSFSNETILESNNGIVAVNPAATSENIECAPNAIHTNTTPNVLSSYFQFIDCGKLIQLMMTFCMTWIILLENPQAEMSMQTVSSHTTMLANKQSQWNPTFTTLVTGTGNTQAHSVITTLPTVEFHRIRNSKKTATFWMKRPGSAWSCCQSDWPVGCKETGMRFVVARR